MCGNHLLLEVTELIRNRNHPSWNIPELSRFVESVIEANGDKLKLIQVHHRSYKNLGNEQPGELACLCRICHVLVSENTLKGDLNSAWEITQNRVNEILLMINNTPDGEREFAQFITYDKFKSDRQVENEQAVNDYYEYIDDYFDIKDEFN